jgi:hypothetical protein
MTTRIIRTPPLFADAEECLASQYAQEFNALGGTPGHFWSLKRARHRDPIYGEPSAGGGWSFDGPWSMPVVFEFAESTGAVPGVTPVGFTKNAEAKLWVARVDLEARGAPVPKEGDIWMVWDRPGNAYRYWDVVNAGRDGHLGDTPTFVQYMITLKHRTDFEPGRKIAEQTRP